MTSRLRGWLLPCAAPALAAGILLGRLAGSFWYGMVGCLLALAAFLLSRGRRRFFACLALTIALGCLRGFFAYHPSLPPAGSCQVTGIVSDEVLQRDSRQIRTVLSRVTLDGVPLSGSAWWTFYSDSLPEGLEPGKQVSFLGTLYHPSGALNPDGYDFREELLRRGIRVGIYGFQDLSVSRPYSPLLAGPAVLRHRLTRLLQARLGDEAGAYASAMLLGNRTLLSREDRTAFSRLGIAHILSVSGFHVGVLIGFLSVLFRLLRLPQRLRWWIYASVLLFYAALCGWNQPVLRASVLLLLMLRGRMLKRPRSLLHLLSAAFSLMLLLSPVQLTGLSFQLSFGAMAGIALVTPFLMSLWQPENRTARRLRNSLAAGLGAQIGILLPELYTFQTLPLLALVMNLPILAFSALLIGVYWAVLVFLPVPGLSEAVCSLARAATSALLALVRSLGVLPGITVWTKAPGLLTCAGIILLTAGLCALFRWKSRSRALLILGGLALTAFSLIPLPHSGTEYYQLAADNADAAVLWDQDSVWVLDAGYEDGAVSDFLHRRRLTPDGVILTHLHADHIYGLKAMMEDQIPIRTVWIPDRAEQAELHPDVLELIDGLRRGGTEIRYLAAGDYLALPSGGMTVLWPEAGKTRPGQDANESSLVLRLDLKGSSLLQTGDLDGKYEMYAAAPADILKVAHHGSWRSSSPEFLTAVSPAAALLSSGDPDRHLSVSERLGDVPVYTTALRGMLTVRFEDGGFLVETFLPEPVPSVAE